MDMAAYISDSEDDTTIQEANEANEANLTYPVIPDDRDAWESALMPEVANLNLSDYLSYFQVLEGKIDSTEVDSDVVQSQKDIVVEMAGHLANYSNNSEVYAHFNHETSPEASSSEAPSPASADANVNALVFDTFTGEFISEDQLRN
jgi:hypothetical protein